MKTSRLTVAVAFALGTAASTASRPPLAAAPDEVRTFEVTVEGDDGTPETGSATARLAKKNGDTATYTLTRTVPGASARYVAGTATVDEQTHVIRATFSMSTPSSVGMVNVLGGSSATTTPPPENAASVTLMPSQPSEYVLKGTWRSGTHSFHETWRELTQLTSTIAIHSPTEAGSYGQDVTFDADVSNADHVVYFVDQYPIDRFAKSGRLVSTKRILDAGWRHFIVRAYGPSPAPGQEGPLVGEAQTVFLARGIHLTPEHGSKVTQPRVRVEATFIGLDAVKALELRVDGGAPLRIEAAPWAADVNLGPHGAHTIEAVAYGADGRELARTHSVVTVATAADDPSADLPLPPSPNTAIAALPGVPVIQHVPANPRNYRPVSQRTIDLIVIHKAEGSLQGTENWFQNPKARASAHYIASDSTVVQFVADENVCWHTGNRAYNYRSVGIENTGFTNRDDMTDAHYQQLGRLVAWLAKKHGIPLDRKHVIGHDEVPNPNWPERGPRFGGVDGHTDPGRYFDWDKLMSCATQATGG